LPERWQDEAWWSTPYKFKEKDIGIIILTNFGRKMMPKAPSKKRPCRVCRRWFTPDVRSKNDQKTCGNPKCKREWHRRQCGKWNQNNPAYFKANYLQKKIERLVEVGFEKTCNPSSPPGESQRTRLEHPSDSRIDPALPRQWIQDQIGTKLFVIITYIIEQSVRKHTRKDPSS
jgi:hypothetical protein